MAVWIGLVGTFLTAVLALTGAVYAAKASRRAAEAQAEAQKEVARTAPYDQLADRVSQLEPLVPRVNKLEREQHVDREYIRVLLTWIGVHAPEHVENVPPAPPWYYEDGDDQTAI